jgi:hypothetical protein
MPTVRCLFAALCCLGLLAAGEIANGDIVIGPQVVVERTPATRWAPPITTRSGSFLARMATTKIAAKDDPKAILAAFEQVQIDLEAGTTLVGEVRDAKRDAFKAQQVDEPGTFKWTILDKADLDRGYAYVLKCLHPTNKRPNYVFIYAQLSPADGQVMTFNLHLTWKDDAGLDMARVRGDVARILASVKVGGASPFAGLVANATSSEWVDKTATLVVPGAAPAK